MAIIMVRATKQTTLCEIETGRTVHISAFDTDLVVGRRLMAMGMLPDSRVEVIRNGHPGPFIVRVRGTRIALGRGVARKIMVK
jgi:ferrous iron transport protein A